MSSDRVENEDYQYQCPVCHAVYGTREEANEHVDDHPGVDPGSVVVL